MTTNIPSNRTWAGLLLIGKRLEPNEITKEARVSPSDSHHAGEARGNTGNIWPYGYWELSSRGKIETDTLSTHIEWILNQIEPVWSKIASVMSSDNNNTASVICFLECLTFNRGLELSAQLLGRLASLNLKLVLDIYTDHIEQF